jgi:hypothetical protein
MSSTRPHHPQSPLRLVGLVLLLACFLSAGAVTVAAQVKLTVKVTVVDENNIQLKSGQVIINRTDVDNGTPKKADINADGLAVVSGFFYTSKVPYGITVKADGYSQDKPPYTIPEGTLSEATNGEVTIQQPIKMIKEGGGPPSSPSPVSSPSQAADQQAGALREHSQKLLAEVRQQPELLDQLLTQIAQEQQPPPQQLQSGASHELRPRLVKYLQGNPQLLSEAAPASPLLAYWWAFALLLALLVTAAVWWLTSGVKSRLEAVASETGSISKLVTTMYTNVGYLKENQEKFIEAARRGAAQQESPPQPQEIQEPARPELTPDGTAGDGAGTPVTEAKMEPAAEAAPTDTPDARARALFSDFVRRQPNMPEPRYLDLDDSVRSSPTSMIQRGKVSLQEVSHPGVFVLYAEDGGEGWVFPNIHLNYSQPALEPIFPELSDTQFTTSQETINPVRVIRDGDRWRVKSGD